MERAYK